MDMSSMSDMSSTPTMTMSMASSSVMMASMTSDPSSGMDMGSGMMMGMQDMMMVFFAAWDTPLWSMAWTPENKGQYAGTCIFLIVLSVIFRVLVSLRCNFVAIYDRAARSHGTPMFRSDPLLEHKAAIYQSRPWRINESLLRAVLDTILAGVSYLLMLAVMTMNVGYFMSVLGGTFLGSFFFGGWSSAAAAH